MTLNDLERFLNDECREILRRVIQGFLDERGPGEVTEQVVNAAGQALTHRRLNSRAMTTTYSSDLTDPAQDFVLFTSDGFWIFPIRAVQGQRRRARDAKHFTMTARAKPTESPFLV